MFTNYTAYIFIISFFHFKVDGLMAIYYTKGKSKERNQSKKNMEKNDRKNKMKPTTGLVLENKCFLSLIDLL